MKRFWLISNLVAALIMPTMSFSAGLSPWEFGIPKSEVSSFSEYGPYRTFSNGDIETLNGIYDGKKENVQFFFDANGLSRIGVYLYEGQDQNVAREAWQRAYDSLTKKFGKVDTPGIKAVPESESNNSKALSIAAAVNVGIVGKLQMAPVDQRKDMFVFSNFWRQDIQGARYFYVVIYFDRRP